MGACQSSDTFPVSNSSAVPKSAPKQHIIDTSKCSDTSPGSSTLNASSKAAVGVTTTSLSKLEPLSSETEECDSDPQTPTRPSPETIYTTSLNDRNNNKNKNNNDPQDVNSRKLLVGYSSGGSSDCSDDSSDNRKVPAAGSRNHLLHIKHSLSVEDLCQGVVRIETDFGRPIEEIYEGVHDGPVLGSGVTGIVRKVKHRKTGVEYAVKCLDLGLIQDEKGLQHLREEVRIMCQLDHPSIVRLEEVYENESEIYLIQELCTGGDLFDRLDEQSDFHYSESKCAKLVKQMLSSIRYLHSKKIIHRDLKLENFLFSSPDKDSDLKMIDFGLSKHFAYAGELQNECVGTPYTVAPEIIVSQYDEKVDIWALGVITFLLLSGETPFGGVDGESLESVRRNVLRGKCYFEPPEIWDHVSACGKDFVKRLLDPDASRRPTAKEAQLDEWLQTYGKRDSILGTTLSPNLCQALVEFKEYSDMRKVLCEVLSFTLLPEQISDLRREFEKVDPEGEGEISLATLKKVLMESAEDGALGSLTEFEVEGIFGALRVRKKDTKIRWHEFIAAGLSQCNFDERNLKLAFDRLDYDRKGFITIEDMKDVLGTNEGEEHEALCRMWRDGLTECVCPLGRITYDQFRMFIKGQKREKEPQSPRRKSRRLSFELSPLQAVPEGTMSPQVKSHVFAKFDDQSALEALRIPQIGILEPPEIVRQPKSADIKIPTDLPVTHQRARSRSLGGDPELSDAIKEELGTVEEDLAEGNSVVVRPSIAINALREVIADESKTPLAVSKALYRKHREFRQSVLVASKLFDQKEKARKLRFAQPDPVQKRASLVMRRGTATPEKLGNADIAMLSRSEHHLKISEGEPETPPKQPAVDESEDQSKRFADASKRSGRVRRPRQKTASDISGMLR